MSRRHRWFIIFGILLTFWILILLPYETWSDVFLHPWHVLWGSGRQLNATLLEASEGDSVKSVSRRLLKPFGAVKLLRVYETDDKTKS